MKSEQEIREKLKKLDRKAKELSRMYQDGEIDAEVYGLYGHIVDDQRTILRWVLDIKLG